MNIREVAQTTRQSTKLGRLSPRSFRTKFILVVGAAVIFDLLLGGGVALWNVFKLGQDATREIEHGLTKASNEYIENYIQTTALRANLLFDRVFAELTTLAGSMQVLIDHPDAKQKIGTAIANTPYFADKLSYDPKGKWVQNAQGETSVISVWSYLLDTKNLPRPNIMRDVRETAIFDLMSSSLMATGSKKLQMYYMGPKDRPIMRTTPYSDQAQTFDKLYPGHNAQNFWDFFFPGVYEGWQAWIKKTKTRDVPSDITATAPYIDAITGNLIVTFFHPLWNQERTDCAGAVAVDITLEQLSELITDVRVADTGFGFLAMSNGNVLAIKPTGEQILGLNIKNDHNDGQGGVIGLERTLSKSIHPDVAALRLPSTVHTVVQQIHLMDASHYTVALRRLQGMNLWADNKIGKEYLSLGFVVPEREIYATLYTAQNEIAHTTERIRNAQIGILLFSLTIVLAAIFGISKRITSGLSILAQAAGRLQKKDYSVRVQVPTRDEVGELAVVFNDMAAEIQNYTANLEQLVAERTQELAKANQEVVELNRRLRADNLRMSAELDVARRLQMMVLPKEHELHGIPELDIAGYMRPADEVGGDYYDVLYERDLVKIGIGDVTGHGLESGVVMLMVQSIVRTLLDSGNYHPARFIQIINGVLYKNINRINTNKNLSLSFLDYQNGVFTLSGQHEEVLIIRNNGELSRIDTMNLGFLVAMEPDIQDFVATEEIVLEEGDTLVLFTDGVTEADDMEKKQYGIERLCASAVNHHKLSANAMCAAIIVDLEQHIGKQTVFDDITLLVVRQLKKIGSSVLLPSSGVDYE